MQLNRKVCPVHTVMAIQLLGDMPFMPIFVEINIYTSLIIGSSNKVHHSLVNEPVHCTEGCGVDEREGWLYFSPGMHLCV